MRNSIPLPFSAIAVFIIVVGLTTGGWAYESKSSNLKNVRVEIVPAQLIPGQPATFKIEMNTHSVELKYDMVNLSTLKDDTGREYQALEWTVRAASDISWCFTTGTTGWSLGSTTPTLCGPSSRREDNAGPAVSPVR